MYIDGILVFTVVLLRLISATTEAIVVQTVKCVYVCYCEVVIRRSFKNNDVFWVIRCLDVATSFICTIVSLLKPIGLVFLLSDVFVFYFSIRTFKEDTESYQL